MGSLSIGDDTILFDDEDAEIVLSRTWRIQRNKRHKYSATGEQTLLHRFLMGCHSGDGILIDHINGNTLDNRRSNLRRATRGQNNSNSIKCRGTSRFKGVYWYKRHAKWHAQIKCDSRRFHLGYFSIEEDAARAYDETARRLYGEFACLNYPREGERSALI